MRVLYLGEGSLDGPARYFAAVLRHAGLAFDHQRNEAPVPRAWLKRSYGAIVLSDYRYLSFSPATRDWLVRSVETGTGLLMIGGWASFTGLEGGYAGTPIEQLLPIECVRGDDRVNWASGSLLVRAQAHPVREALSFDHPPMVCGYHRANIRPGADVILALRDLETSGEKVRLGEPHPLLVLGRYGQARTAAFLTDCAPHWAGGLVDWGKKRVTVRVAPGIQAELGDQYLKLFQNLIHWLAGACHQARI